MNSEGWLKMQTPLVALGVALVVGACAYHTPPRTNIDNPAVAKWAWFSYLDGNDIRETCVSGSLDRYRLVYNAQYNKQVRVYEATSDGAGGAYLVSRARSGSPNLSDWRLSDPMSPWRWSQSDVRLAADEFREFAGLVGESGLDLGAPVGKKLHSKDFYWVAAACRGGIFAFHAWVDAQGDFDRIRFTDFLRARDRTGLAYREAVPVPPQDKIITGRRKGQNPPDFFILTVEEDGIGGLINAF
jgi:hypothetical protein